MFGHLTVQPEGCQKKRTDIGILGNQAKNANAKCARIGIVQSAAGGIVSAARASFSAGDPFAHAHG
jgi:hypothetical protein